MLISMNCPGEAWFLGAPIVLYAIFSPAEFCPILLLVSEPHTYSLPEEKFPSNICCSVIVFRKEPFGEICIFSMPSVV